MGKTRGQTVFGDQEGLFAALDFFSPEAYSTVEGVGLDQFVAWIHSNTQGGTHADTGSIVSNESGGGRASNIGDSGGGDKGGDVDTGGSDGGVDELDGGDRITKALLKLDFDHQLRNSHMRRRSSQGGGLVASKPANSKVAVGTEHSTTTADSFFWPQRVLIAFACSITIAVFIGLVLYTKSHQWAASLDLAWVRLQNAESEAMLQVETLLTNQVADLQDQYVSALQAQVQAQQDQALGAVTGSSPSASAEISALQAERNAQSAQADQFASAAGFDPSSATGDSNTLNQLASDFDNIESTAVSGASTIDSTASSATGQLDLSAIGGGGDTTSGAVSEVDLTSLTANLLGSSNLESFEPLKNALSQNMVYASTWGSVIAFVLVLLIWGMMLLNYRTRVIKARRGDYTLIWKNNQMKSGVNYIGLQMFQVAIGFIMLWIPW
jgi:hypothetical protein